MLQLAPCSRPSDVHLISLSCRLEDGDGNISWSAPVFFDLIIPGATAEFRHIECCFIIPDGPSLQAFVQARPILGTGAPVSRGGF